MHPPLSILAQAPAPPPPSTGGGTIGWAMLWAVLLIAAVIAATWALLLIRKRTLGPRTPGEDMGFSLNELRELHRAGRLSDAEFESARRRLLGSEERTAGRNPVTGALRALPGHDLTGDPIPRSKDNRPE